MSTIDLSRYGERTIERYLSDYRKFGLDGLRPKIRQEHGKLKAFREETLEQTIKIRLKNPRLSADNIIDALRTSGVAGAEQNNLKPYNYLVRK